MLNAEFLITSLIVVLIPGTGVVYTVSTGLFLGWRASVAAALGCTAGIIPHLSAGILGLSALLHLSAVAFQAMKYAGAMYLLYLAWLMWRDTGALRLNSSAGPKSLLKIAIRGFLMNILNPKLSIFFLAFLPLFVSSETSSPVFDMFVLSVVFMAMTFVIFVVYGVLANGVRKNIVNSPRTLVRLQRSFAAVFAALGAKLAVTEQ
ncbi:MAG: LysE family translocator [Desulfopila sp.]|jgi:threonine/homoserine/homoserine lactone efflux protein|nr:LysE family translocator [Desulfopila sp.]